MCSCICVIVHLLMYAASIQLFSFVLFNRTVQLQASKSSGGRIDEPKPRHQLSKAISLRNKQEHCR